MSRSYQSPKLYFNSASVLCFITDSQLRSHRWQNSGLALPEYSNYNTKIKFQVLEVLHDDHHIITTDPRLGFAKAL